MFSYGPMILTAAWECKKHYNLTDIRLNLRPVLQPFLSTEMWPGLFGYIVCCTFSFCFHTAKMELNDRNILNVLHKAKFADAHWELLGMQLITHSALCNIRANRNGQANLCMIDTIVQWLSTDAAKSWEKLAEAIAKVEGYGEVTVDAVRQEAGIGKATELKQKSG